MEPIKEIKAKKAPRIDRISLKPDALERLEKWASTISDRTKARVKKSDLAQWVIMSHPPTLSEAEIVAIEKLFFDEIKYAEWILKQVREKKARGETVNLSELIPTKRSPH